MIKKIVLLSLAFYFLLSSETFSLADNKYLSLDAKVSYVSKYMWRGFDLLGGDPAWQHELSVGFKDTGFYMGIWESYGTKSEWDIWDEWDYYGGYNFTILEGSPFSVNMDLSYTYFHYPHQNKYIDSQEIAMAFRMINLYSKGNTSLIPYWTLYYSFAAHQNEVKQEGWWLKGGVELIQKIADQEVILFAESFINDGGASMCVDSGVSHMTAGTRTSFDLGICSLIPAIYYQRTFEDTVNQDENEFYYTLTVSKSF